MELGERIKQLERLFRELREGASTNTKNHLLSGNGKQVVLSIRVPGDIAYRVTNDPSLLKTGYLVSFP